MRLFHSRILPAAAGLFLCTAFAAAQGANDCANAQAITGLGPHAFDTTSATTDGQPELIYTYATGLIYEDVWFSWTAPATTAYEVSTCGQTTLATAIAVYNYGCTTVTGHAQSARSSTCGAQTILTIGTVAGQTYLIRIGSTSPGSTGTGTFTITETSLPAILGSAVYSGNGRTYHILDPSSWHVAQAAATQLGGNLVTVNDAAENDFLQQTFWNWGGSQRSFWIGYNDEEAEGTWKWVSGETPGYEKWSSDGAPNDWLGCEHFAHFRYDWGDGSWNDAIGDPYPVHWYGTVHGVVEVDGGPGAPYCFGNANEGNPCPCGNDNDGTTPLGGCQHDDSLAGARLDASGEASVSADTLVLEGSRGPISNSTLFFQADNNLNGTGNFLGDGIRCAGGGLIRLKVKLTDASGNADSSPAVITARSASFGHVIQPGETLYYQWWIRDSNGSPCGLESNTSNGYEITWIP